MSHFYGRLQGCRGETTRTGSKGSGINAHIRSWNNDVYASLDDEEGDVLRLTIPHGLKVRINGKVFDLEIFEKRHEEERAEDGI